MTKNPTWFQKGDGSKTSPYATRTGVDIRIVHQICATCFLMDRELRDHGELFCIPQQGLTIVQCVSTVGTNLKNNLC
ncbi:hypothetical protein DPMN_054671 [Dreissena polymorpha]|uniref:Uncharacterized protein n=1 Tax=Dreissena polymorpha TaxID=45954 RepID=A0A9D4HRS8_DREPO|nr:hypothetical protein DPMN_054671 [Dreissena polymorpha]